MAIHSPSPPSDKRMLQGDWQPVPLAMVDRCLAISKMVLEPLGLMFCRSLQSSRGLASDGFGLFIRSSNLFSTFINFHSLFLATNYGVCSCKFLGLFPVVRPLTLLHFGFYSIFIKPRACKLVLSSPIVTPFLNIFETSEFWLELQKMTPNLHQGSLGTRSETKALVLHPPSPLHGWTSCSPKNLLALSTHPRGSFFIKSGNSICLAHMSPVVSNTSFPSYSTGRTNR